MYSFLASLGLISILVWFIVAIFWVVNIVQLVRGPAVWPNPSNVTIVKVIGIPIVPIGAVMGIIGTF